MSPETLASVIAVPQVLPLEDTAPRRRPRRPSFLAAVARRLLGFVGWLWRWLIGALFCLDFFGSVLVVGWTYRWMQGRVLYGWWRHSKLAAEGSFEEFCATLGPKAPVRKPRWFVQERMREALCRPGPYGGPPGGLRVVLRVLRLPWHSLWLNFKVGLLGLVCTYLATGWGCLLMLFGWEFGWLNSFHKGYEQAIIGPGVSFLGMGLLIAALFYVPMAQVHQAVTGEARAFFDFRFVWALIRARLTAYLGAVALIALASLPFEILKTATGAIGNNSDLSDAEVLHALNWYLFWSCMALFPTLLLLRRVATRVYRSAVLKVLREGTVMQTSLHPVLADWLRRLDLLPIPVASPLGLGQTVLSGGRWGYRVFLYALLAVIWFLFLAKTYVGEFIQYHPIVGFLNHVLIQFPCFDFVPEHLKAAVGG